MKTRDRQSFWRHFRRGRPARLNLENVLGTSLELQLVVDDAGTARRAESVVLDEIDRLSAILNQHTGASELARWQTTLDCDAVVSPELADVLASANRWCDLTRGAFHPGAIALRPLPADEDARGAILERMRHALWTVDENRGVARRLSTLPMSLDGMAKGYIVSCAAARARDVVGVSQVLLNVGGDIQHFGSSSVLVGVANPASGAENDALLATVRLRNEALATSGGYRRGSLLDGEWQSHIVDPRSGKPAREIANASVIAPDCASADALSTAFSVLDPAQSLAIAESLPGVGCLIVDAHGSVTTNAEWNNHASLAGR